MSVLADFYTTDSIQLDPVGLNLVESPHLLIAGVPAPEPLIPEGPLSSQSVPCVSKVPGRLNATLVILGITIRFEGTFLGVDRGGRWLVRWGTDDRTRQPFMGATITRVHGQFTVAIAPLEPVRTDLTACTGASSEFFISLSLMPVSTLEDRFRTLPNGQIAENEIRIETTLTTRIRALITSLQGNAGVVAPPPTPWPQPASVTLSAYCRSWSRFPQSVFGQVHLDTPVRRSHTRFTCQVTAEGLEPPRSIDVQVRQIIGASVFFEVVVPAGLTGQVRVTAVTNDRSRAVSVEFRIADPAGIGCDTPFGADYYEPIRIGCDAYDCGWTGLNDLAELIGQSGGWAVRYLTTRQIVESLGQLVGENGLLQAINNYGRVIGIVDQGEGKIDSFVYGELDPDGFTAPELAWVPGVALYGLNDAGVAVGGRFDGNRMVAVRWVKGKVEELQVPSVSAVALAINSVGNIAGMYIGKDDLQDRGFVIDDQGFHDLGDFGGKIITLAMNDAGVVAGTILTEKSVLGFVYSAETGLSDLKSFIGSSQAVVSGINAAGLVVGTVRGEKDGDRRGFRFMEDRGGEDLNQFVKADRMLIVEEAIAVNNSGQILAFGIEKGEAGYFLLNPVSIPQPQLPIP